MLTATPSAQNLEHTGRKEILFGGPQRLCFDVRGGRVILQNCTEEGPAIHQQHWDFQEVRNPSRKRRLITRNFWSARTSGQTDLVDMATWALPRPQVFSTIVLLLLSLVA
jgi:hypothetical protein